MILKSRYNDEYFFQEVSDGIYQGYFGDYCSIIMDNNTIVAVDPSGGPFITKGFVLPNNRIVKSIDEYNGNFILIT